MVSSAVTAIHHENPDIQVIHLTGHADEDAVRNGYAAQGVPHYVQAFSDRMAGIYAAADLAVCRSGAATCAELCAFGVPGLLVPYPHATHNHQLLNARALEKKNAADVILEQDLSLDWLMDYIRQCMQTPARLARMSEAVLKLSRKDAAELLADLVVRTGRHWIKKTGGAERAG
jgi:UDP-N-acetylglucosamine--N-acetylmuramyl-(pentapeptide) pyrophosphoryl-undecaprenol N-acetylglucosamine transferase